MNDYIKSSLITFVAGFAIVFVTEIDTITLESFQDGALAGLFFVAVRTGMKAVLESFIAWYASRK